MKFLKSMGKMVCGWSCTKSACAVHSDAIFSVMREKALVRSYDAMTRSPPVTIPVLHRPRLPPIPEEDEEHGDDDNDKEVVRVLDETESWAMHLCPAVLSMSDGAERKGAVNDKSSESGGFICKVYSPKAARGVSVTITNAMWRPHLPPIPEEEVSSYDGYNDASGKTVNRDFVVGMVLGSTAAGASDYEEAIKEVLALMASSGTHQPTSA